MNTANAQLEGLYLAIAAVNRLLVRKGIVSREELQDALQEAEMAALNSGKDDGISHAHELALVFPIRLLIKALSAEHTADFRELARQVGRAD
ncbi:hypothetical protein [Rhizobium paknamense]|uniref:Uncharacterized protein n=1 Tax=Rhizobium paknamense TaxID=1206817 RepID=A0ABU0IFS1_9HYPH|nr:hypothetical protein [Rhizobium paknamense]MDQ0456488.1 hypothetical protein [Rhizobium paknamense]